MVMNYDKGADVLYISFSDPPVEADDAMRIGDIILRKRDNACIGITILNIKQHLEAEG